MVADELEVSFPYVEDAGGCLSISPESVWIKRTATMLKEVFNTEPEYYWMGASIPILAELSKATNREAILVGFGLESNRIHAPNEHFELEQFENGFLYACSLFQEFSKD